MPNAVERAWTVRDVMSEDVLTATVDTPFKVLVEELLLSRVSGLPVVDRGRVVGLVSEADLLVKEAQGAAGLDTAAGRTAGDLMTSPAVTIGPDDTLAAAASLMHRRDLKRLPVIDDTGRLVGIVSRADLLRVFMLTDGAIERAARNVLDAVLTDLEAVRVFVTDGIVRLDGEVEAQPEAEAAVTRIGALPGVVGVADRLRAPV